MVVICNFTSFCWFNDSTEDWSVPFKKRFWSESSKTTRPVLWCTFQESTSKVQENFITTSLQRPKISRKGWRGSLTFLGEDWGICTRVTRLKIWIMLKVLLFDKKFANLWGRGGVKKERETEKEGRGKKSHFPYFQFSYIHCLQVANTLQDLSKITPIFA